MTRTKSIIGPTVLASLFAAFIVMVSFSNSAFAGRVILSDTHSRDDILRSCVGAGGTFSSSSDGYSCQGEKGSVSCNKDGKCYGDCPSCGDNPDTTKGGGTAEGVLSGATLKAGTTTRPAPASEPKQSQESTQKPIATKPTENHAEKPVENHSDKHPSAEKSNVEKH